MTGPAIAPLYPYQKHWLDDRSATKAARWTRSGGKTHVVMLEPVIDCYEADLEKRRVPWFVFSGADGQTVEMLRYAAVHAQAINTAFEAFTEDETVFVDGKQLTFTKHVVEFEHGSRIVGLPTNPLTIRGRHGNLIWDEAGKTPNDEELWASAAPIASRSGFKMRAVGTPGAKRGPFYEFFLPGSGWSCHIVDIYQAIREGAPLDLEKIQIAVGRGRRWRTEYLVEFEDGESRLIPLELIAACEDADAPLVPFVRIDAERLSDWRGYLDADKLEHAPSDGYDSPEAWKRLFAPLGEGGDRRLFLGFDIARKRHLSVLWVVEVDGFFRRTRAVVAFKGRRFAEQRAALFAALTHCRRAAIDSTGLGAQLAEETVEQFGEHRVEAIDFNVGVKEDLATRMLRGYEDRTQRIPPSSEIRESVNSVYKILTASGHARYDAETTEESGHADYFWAQGLALLAAGDGGQGSTELASFGKRRWSRSEAVL